MACASATAERGHSVTLFDAASEIGGQFNMAKKVVIVDDVLPLLSIGDIHSFTRPNAVCTFAFM